MESAMGSSENPGLNWCGRREQSHSASSAGSFMKGPGTDTIFSRMIQHWPDQGEARGTRRGLESSCEDVMLTERPWEG